jgi:uncharacterized membrane protein YsdA (DUF1294 family)
LILLALSFLLAANLLAFLVYGFDKRQAVNGGWRVSEASLILLAILGGVGAWIGCEVHRHKTRKPAFRRWLVIAVALHLLLVFGVIALLPA